MVIGYKNKNPHIPLKIKNLHRGIEIKWYKEPRKIREDNPGDNIIALSRDNRGNAIASIICFALSLRLSDYRQRGRASRRNRTAYNERTQQG